MGDAKPAPAAAAPPAKAPEGGKNGTRVDRTKKVEGKPHRFTKRPRGYVREKMGYTFFNPIEVLTGGHKEKKPGNAVAPAPYSGYFAASKPGKEWVDPRATDKNYGKAQPAPSAPKPKPEPKPAPAAAAPAPATTPAPTATATPAPTSAPTPTTTPTTTPAPTSVPTPTPTPTPAPPATPAPTSAPTPTPTPTSAPTATPAPVVVEREEPTELDSGIVCESCDDENSAVKYCEDCGFPLCQPCVDSHLKLKITKTHSIVELPEAECESCEEGGIAQSYCMDCTANLCGNCLDAHRKLKVTKDHKIVPLAHKDEGEKEAN